MSNDSIKHIFPFFDLSKELREMIHGKSLVDTSFRLSGLLLEAKNVPPTSMLLISKQFKQQVEERAQKHSHLSIKDDWLCEAGDDCIGYEEMETVLPTPATKTRHLTLEAAADYHDSMCGPENRFPSVTVQMDWLRSFTVKILAPLSDDPGSSYHFDRWNRTIRQQSWWRFREFKTMQIFDAGCGCGEGIRTVLKGKREAPLAMEWKVIQEVAGRRSR